VIAVGRGIVALALASAVQSACARTLPEEDRRILESTPIAKLSTEDLWKDYQQNPANANAQYWGKAIEIAGEVTAVAKDRTPPQIIFGPAPDGHVRAALLGDQAAALLEAAVTGQRIRLKCYCAGPDGAVIVLKSCVKP
jgi:hypothetical protein